MALAGLCAGVVCRGVVLTEAERCGGGAGWGRGLGECVRGGGGGGGVLASV